MCGLFSEKFLKMERKLSSLSEPSGQHPQWCLLTLHRINYDGIKVNYNTGTPLSLRMEPGKSYQLKIKRYNLGEEGWYDFVWSHLYLFLDQVPKEWVQPVTEWVLRESE